MTIYNSSRLLPYRSAHEVLFPREILGHKIACFYASEGFPNKYDTLLVINAKTIIMVILII